MENDNAIAVIRPFLGNPVWKVGLSFPGERDCKYAIMLILQKLYGGGNITFYNCNSLPLSRSSFQELNRFYMYRDHDYARPSCSCNLSSIAVCASFEFCILAHISSLASILAGQ